MVLNHSIFPVVVLMDLYTGVSMLHEVYTTVKNEASSEIGLRLVCH